MSGNNFFNFFYRFKTLQKIFIIPEACSNKVHHPETQKVE